MGNSKSKTIIPYPSMDPNSDEFYSKLHTWIQNMKSMQEYDLTIVNQIYNPTEYVVDTNVWEHFFDHKQTTFGPDYKFIVYRSKIPNECRYKQTVLTVLTYIGPITVKIPKRICSHMSTS